MDSPFHILVVDDDADIARATSHLLTRAGYAVASAGTGGAAMQALRETQVDLLLLDRVLSDIDGVDLCRSIKADRALADLMVVIITGSLTSDGNQIEGLQAGADAYLHRPIDNANLLARVQAFARVQRTNAVLRKHASDLEQRNEIQLAQQVQSRADAARQQASIDHLTQMRRAALNLLEDAAEARTRQEAAILELRAQIERREKSDAALRESEARLQLVVDSSGDGVWDWDPQLRQGRFSARWKEMLGYTEDEPDSCFHDVAARTHPDDLARITASVAACVSGASETVQIEHRQRCKDGSWKWVLTRGRAVGRDGQGRAVRLIGTTSDISVRKTSEARLQLAGSVFSHAREGMLITDGAGSILDVNESFTRDTGYGPDEVLGRNPRLLQSGRHDAEFFAGLWQALAQNRHWYGEIWNRRRSGEVYASMLTIVAVCDAAGTVQSYLGMFTDMTPFKEYQKQLERVAHYDPITGLPNRTLLESRAGQDIVLARRGDTPLALMMLSIDRLKQINSTLGHAVGDQLLVAFGQRVQAVLPEQATLARVAGEGFVLVLPGHDSDAAARLALQLLIQVAEPYRIDAQDVTVTASMGIAMFPEDGQDFE